MTITDTLNRAHLKLHDESGVKQSKGRLAIPTADVKHTAHGVTQAQLPRNLDRAVVIRGFIFQRTGKGKSSKLRLMYVLKPSANQPADVPFTDAFNTAMFEGVRTTFPDAMAKAIRTRR